MIEAVDRLDVKVPYLAVLQHLERNGNARAALRPHLAVKVGQILRRLAIDAHDHIAAPDTGFLCRAARRDPADEPPPAQFSGRNTEPRPSRTGRAPGRNEVSEDRRQAVDRHEHVAGRLPAAASRVADDERT